MNYNQTVNFVRIYYADFEYLIQNWEEECKIIHKWAEIVNVEIERIEKPESEEINVGVLLKK